MDQPIVSIDDLAWIQQSAPLPLLVKRIVTAEDARLAVGTGIDRIVVSNHGGRRLVGTPAALDALVEVAEAVEVELRWLSRGAAR